MILTTITSDASWPPAEVFDEYKAQQAVERRLPILKDPKRVGAVYLENPARVEAFGFLLILAVLVYSVIECRARRALADADEPVWLVGEKTSFRPTGRRVLERFEDMTVMRAGKDKRTIPTYFDVPTRVLDVLDLSVAVFGVDPSTQRAVTTCNYLPTAFIPFIV